MPHWRAMMDSDWLRHVDIEGKEPTVTITRVVGGELTNVGGKKARKPILYFEGKEKPLAIGATIGKTIERMYGPKTEDWIGKRITLFTTTTNAMSGEIVGCIRVRPTVPVGKGQKAPVTPAPREPGEDEDEDAINRRNAAPTEDEVPR
jgi:hypothetical protein